MSDQFSPSVADTAARFGYIQHLAGLFPNDANIQNDYASALFTLGRVQECRPVFEKAHSLSLNSGIILNLGMTHKEVGDFDKSRGPLYQSYTMNSDNWYASLAWSETLLREGLWRDAWANYDEARGQTKFSSRILAGCGESILEWNGQPLDEPLYVLGEGGWGDRINYTRFLPNLTAMGIQYVFDIDLYGEQTPAGGIVKGSNVNLRRLYERLPWIDMSLYPKPGEDPKQVPVKHWTTIFSLMAKLQIMPDEVPFFPTPWTVQDELIEKYKFLRGDGSKPVVGIVWSAGEKFEGDRKFRSMTDLEVGRIVNETKDQIHWVSLQHGVKLSPPFQDVKWQTWDETAAIIANCDGVITVDTGTMHLAGAMDKPLWILLSSNSDWKFLRNRADCVWYPKAELIRNGIGGGFQNAIDITIDRLKSGDYPGKGRE